MYLGSGIRLAVSIAVRATVGRRAGITWPHGNALWWLLSAIAAGCAVSPNLLMLGLHLTDAASASLILDIEGIFTVLLAWIVFKKNRGQGRMGFDNWIGRKLPGLFLTAGLTDIGIETKRLEPYADTRLVSPEPIRGRRALSLQRLRRMPPQNDRSGDFVTSGGCRAMAAVPRNQ